MVQADIRTIAPDYLELTEVWVRHVADQSTLPGIYQPHRCESCDLIRETEMERITLNETAPLRGLPEDAVTGGAQVVRDAVKDNSRATTAIDRTLVWLQHRPHSIDPREFCRCGTCGSARRGNTDMGMAVDPAREAEETAGPIAIFEDHRKAVLACECRTCTYLRLGAIDDGLSKTDLRLAIVSWRDGIITDPNELLKLITQLWAAHHGKS